MSKPESVKTDPWTGFPKQAYSFLTDDFVHEKSFVFKLAAKSAKATINVKQTLSIKESKDGKEKVKSIADEVSLWFDLTNGASFYTKVKTDYIKVLYDAGRVNFQGKPWNLYASINSNKGLENLAFKLGFANLDSKCRSDNRFKVSMVKKEPRAFWYNRTVVNHNKFTYGWLSVLDLTNKILQKNDVLVAYNHSPEHQVFLRASTKNYREKAFDFTSFNEYFDSITANWIYSVNPEIKVGTEASFCVKSLGFGEATLALEKKIPKHNWTVKGKVSTKTDLALTVKGPSGFLGDIATITYSVGVSNSLANNRRIDQGIQLDFSL